MIKSKNDLRKYLYHDQVALNMLNKKNPRMFHDVIWSYQILLRKCEYIINCKKGYVWTAISKIYKFRFVKLSQKLGYSIPFNVFGPGLSIAHIGTIVVNEKAKIGAYCRIHEGVTVGISGIDYKGTENSISQIAPVIGNNVFIGSGAKIIGRVKIGNNIAVGANAVVVKNILENGITVAGIPAEKISNHDSKNYIFHCEGERYE